MKGAHLTRVGLALLLTASLADAQRSSSPSSSRSYSSSSSGGGFGGSVSRSAPANTYRSSAPAPSAPASTYRAPAPAPASARPANTYSASPYAKLGASTAAPKTSVTPRAQVTPPSGDPYARLSGTPTKQNATQPASKTAKLKIDHDDDHVAYVPTPSLYVTPATQPSAYAPAPRPRSSRTLVILLAALIILTLIVLAYRAGHAARR